MKTVLLLLFSCVTANANNSIYDVSCTDRSEGLYFEPVSGVRGRITLQWCTAADTKVKKWNLNLSYFTSLKPEQCISNYASSKEHHLHSSFDEVVPVNLNCTNVCFKTFLDAIFHSTCYKISTSQSSENETLLHYDQYHYVNKNDSVLTIEDVSKSTTSAHYQGGGEDIIIDWLPAIPVSLYHAYINDVNDSRGSYEATKEI
ncbi:jg22827 [Pararge aegeria aegeria]|uniref:Jg22827 protein n=1 Tax=Pararge aegeria aegeria TaxID=348720 RepID=A0A8S4RWY3_9NEOP|nr:jg22827 [Pararge aegeria aegeria]